MKKRRIRNVNVCDLHDAKTIKRISKLSKDDDGVCFRFELPVFDEAFISYAKECIAILKRSQIDNYTFSMVTHNPDSTQGFVKTSTKILSTKELENLIELEELIPETANLVISEKFINKLKCKFSNKMKIETIDERLTTVQAHKTMNFLNVNKYKKKDIVDTISAVYILETFLKQNN